MIKVLFGDIASGRLARLPYLGYYVLLTLLIAAFGIGVAVMIGVSEQLIGGDLQQAQDTLRQWLSPPFMVVLGLVVVGVLFAGANIMAKRLRDIGLPGWWSVLAVAVLTGAVSFAVSEQASSGLHLLIALALALIPTGAFSKGARGAAN